MTTMTFRTALIALLLPISGTAIAQTPPPPPPTPSVDRAAGGGMTLAQFQAQQAERMMAADTDHDGRISLAEWTARASARRPGGGGGYDPARMFARMDTNHDGFLDRSEIDAASAERFQRMDANGDGIITPDENRGPGGGHWQGGHGRHGAPQDAEPAPPPAPQQ